MNTQRPKGQAGEGQRQPLAKQILKGMPVFGLVILSPNLKPLSRKRRMYVLPWSVRKGFRTLQIKSVDQYRVQGFRFTVARSRVEFPEDQFRSGSRCWRLGFNQSARWYYGVPLNEVWGLGFRLGLQGLEFRFGIW